MIVLAALFGTLAAFMPTSNDCGAALSLAPEPGIYRILIRSRPVGASVWRDTIRMAARPEWSHGGSFVAGFVHHLQPMERQVAAVDSAGNVACWSNGVVK